MLDTSLSLLERLQSQPLPDDWKLLVELYTPLIRGWLRRDPALREEADDLTQEVLSVLVQELPHFRRQRPGSFRCWLRTITVNRLKAWGRDQGRRPQARDSVLAQLADPDNDLSRQWDREHDEHVVRRLLDLIEPEFTSSTWKAFRRLVLDSAKPAAAAAELGLSVNAVLVAKSRVLKRLREVGRGLLG